MNWNEPSPHRIVAVVYRPKPPFHLGNHLSKHTAFRKKFRLGNLGIFWHGAAPHEVGTVDNVQATLLFHRGVNPRRVKRHIVK
jgi:hypothetical protein